MKSRDLFVSTFGTGRPMLCLHGIEGQGVRYIGLAARLDGVRVVAPDLRGHGRSAKTGPWTVSQQMDDLLPLLDLVERPGLLLGHSYGGFLAWEIARIAADRIAALILVDPAIELSDEVTRECTTHEASIVGHSWPDQGAAFAELSAARPESGQWSAALDVALATERSADGVLRPLIAPEAVRACYEQLRRPLTASSYRGPTLLIEAGREDGRFVSASVVAGLRAQLGEALEHVVIDATHTIPSDFPDLLAEVVRSFLARVQLV
jgi:lipase